MVDLKNSLFFINSRIRFSGKFILIAVTLLALSQALGTFISVLTFETILVKTITAKYEILGKDLKRRIEQSLKFGKRLEQFIGMDKLVKPIYLQTEDLSEIVVADITGKRLFSSKRKPSFLLKNLSRTNNSPEPFHIQDITKQTNLPVETVRKEKGSATKLHEGKYYVLFTIKPAFGETPGILALVFPKSVIDQKKFDLVKNSINKLMLSMVLTAILMGIMIHFHFTRPSEKKIKMLIQRFWKGEKIKNYDMNEAQNEIQDLYWHIATFRDHAHQKKAALDQELHAISTQIEKNTELVSSIEQKQRSLKGELDETD